MAATISNVFNGPTISHPSILFLFFLRIKNLPRDLSPCLPSDDNSFISRVPRSRRFTALSQHGHPFFFPTLSIRCARGSDKFVLDRGRNFSNEKKRKGKKKTKKRSEKWCANKRETTKGLPRRVIIVDGLGGGVGWKTKKKEKKKKVGEFGCFGISGNI